MQTLGGRHGNGNSHGAPRVVSSTGSHERQHHSVDTSAPELEHAWIFQFVDIIYVATVFNISGLMEKCGPSTSVYVVCFAYFVVMFSSRLVFDEYNCISRAKGVVHLIAFCLYGAGVFVMTVNIYAKAVEGEAGSEGTDEYVLSAIHENTAKSDYGNCQRSTKYDIGFASAFIFTRAVLVIMYVLYFYVFHESNLLNHIVSHDLQMTTITANTHQATAAADDDAYQATSNPLAAHRPTLSVEEMFRGIHGPDRESFVERHFSSIVAVKILPAVLSSLVMIGMLTGASPAVVLPIVAAIEFVGGFLPSLLITDPQKWRELTLHRHFALERLGLFFMLVMGEAILNLAVRKAGDEPDFFKIYTVLLFCFFTVFSVGMQFFEQLQSVVKDPGPHPLDIRHLSPFYIWLVCLTSFFMLAASNGMTGIYSKVIDEESDLSYSEKKVANGLGSVGILIIALRLMDKAYYRYRLLPGPLYDWFETFYDPHYKPETSGIRDRSARTISDSSAKTESGKSTSLRRIFYLSLLRLCVSALQFVMFTFQIPVLHYMGYTFLVIAVPNAAEVAIETYYYFCDFFHQRRVNRDKAAAAASRAGSTKPGVVGNATAGPRHPALTAVVQGQA